MRRSAAKAITAMLAASLITASAASAAQSPPPPQSPTGKSVTLVAAGGGLTTPTAFAFGAGTVFEGDGGAESSKIPNGGVFALKDGKGFRIASSMKYVSGLAWHDGSLYVAGGGLGANHSIAWTINRWSGWNGKKFASQKAVYTAPSKFQGFDGIAFGPNGRLYVGVAASGTNNNDHGPANTSPYLYDILTLTDTGKNLKVFAMGMRQPWQLAFAPDSSSPFVSDLGQDMPKSLNPPDFVLHVHQGDNYGFPKCAQVTAVNCTGDTKPFKEFAPHSDIMGMAIVGKTLYMSSFAGLPSKSRKSKGGEVISMPLGGGTVTPVLTGFVAPIVALGANNGRLYVGEVTGQIYSVHP